MWSNGFLIMASIGMAVVGWMALMWAIRNGQFDDVEAIKYRILDNEDENPSWGENED